jgi:hypothetical protein
MTADLRRPLTDPLEVDLRTLFDTKPSPGVLEALDRRIDDRLQAWDPRESRHARRRSGRKVAIIGLLAAALVIGGATGNLQALYLLAAGPFDLPWHRGEALDLSQTVDGYRVTIDRAYADATRLALAISVVDEERRPGITQLSAMGAIVTDEDGEYGGLGAMSTPDGPFAAVNVAWKVPSVLPLPSGPRTFRVVIPSIQVRDDSIPPVNDDEWWPWHEHAGPWTYEFELDVDGGTTITPDVSVEKNGVTVQVIRVIAASDIIRVDARIEGAPKDDPWSPIGSITHGGRTARFVVSSMNGDGTVALFTESGLGDGRGAWSITFDELAGNERMAGPWILEFDGP